MWGVVAAGFLTSGLTRPGRAKVIVGMFTVQKTRFVYPNGRAEEVQEDWARTLCRLLRKRISLLSQLSTRFTELVK